MSFDFIAAGCSEARHCTKRYEPERYWPELKTNLEWFDLWLMGGEI